MSSSTGGLVLGLCTTGLYGYALYYLYTPQILRGFDEHLPKYKAYGQLKYLTVQCLVIQLVSSVLHVLAHFVRALRGVRDFVFTTLAFPVGSAVVTSFWLILLVMDRELIFPSGLDSTYPRWLNHTNHTLLLPINIVLAALVHHKYLRNGALVTLGYLSCYSIFLHVFKAQTGLFVYPYLDEFNDTGRVLYFAAKGVFAYLMYKLGQSITRKAHESEKAPRSRKRPEALKGSKQR